MSQELLLDLGFLTEEERDIINGVIFKDGEMRRQEQSRISNLRNELDELKENGLPDEDIEAKNERYCARCQTYFGIILNTGALCARCELRVCKKCRADVDDGDWLCTLCFKVREVKAQSGAWFFQGHKEKNGNLFGSLLVRNSLRRLPPLPSGQNGQETRPNNRDAVSNMTSAAVNYNQQYDDDSDHYETVDVRKSSPNVYDTILQLDDASDVDSDEGGHEARHTPEYHSTGSDGSHSRGDESPRALRDDEEEKPGDDSTWEAGAHEMRPGEEPTLPEDPGDELGVQAEDVRAEDVRAEDVQAEDVQAEDVRAEDVQAELPQVPSDDISSLYATVNKKTRKSEPSQDTVSPPAKSSELSPTAKEPSSIDSRESALRAFSETFSSLQTKQGDVNAREDRHVNAREDRDDDLRFPDSRFDAHGVFSVDNESSFSETSGYVTPTASEDTSSKRTPSISGDEGTSTPKDEQRSQTQESTPVIVTSRADIASNSNRSSIVEYEEDLDVSFSKYGASLGNRMLKDQLSMGSRESIASYYSNAGGEVYGKYPVTGEIYFGIMYDPKIQEFQVQVHQARGIAAVDEKHGISDPYVKSYLLPDRSRGGKRKTKVQKNTINPVFDEIITYKITYDEILQRTLWLAVWNHDRFGHNDFLGEVLVPLDQYHQCGFSLEDPEPQWYDLCERQADDSLMSYNGEIVLALKYVPPSSVVSKKKKKKKKGEEEKGELHINIVEASNLLAKDSNGFSDPFCKSYLLPDKSKKTKQKTAMVKKTLNPKWNHEFVYDKVSHEELMDRVLELTVWDFDRGSSNEFLGGVRLGLGANLKEWDDANSEEQAAWNKMLNNQNNWNQVTLTLRDNMAGNHKYKGSTGELSGSGDPSLMEIQPNDDLSQDLVDGHHNPDEELMIRHSEYHRPYESKIVTAMKSSDARLSSPTSTAGSAAKQMTLAELARTSRANTETKDEPRPASSVPSVGTANVTIEVSPSKDEDADSLVRHSEFYKGSWSPNLSRRKSADFQTPAQESRLEERRPTLVDMLQTNQDTDDNGNRLGSHLSVDDDFMGSRESIYSADGIYSNNSVSGEILIGYQYVNGMFKIKIFEARGLTAIDKTKDTSDPYAKVYLLPDQSRAGKRKSKTKYGTLDPEFNEEMLYKISTNELVTRTIWVSVCNYDRFGRNEFLGEVRIPLGDYKGLEEHPKWHKLLEMLPVSTADSQGELVVGLMYAPADKKRKKGANAGKLYVKIVEGRNLPGKDSDNLSDPFCKSYLLPDPAKKTKKKTPVLKKNLNPHWDHKFTYDNLSSEELQNRVLELTVWDHDLGTNDFLGGVRIGLGTSEESWDDCEGDEVTLWQFLLSKPNTWTQSTLHLRNQMGSRKGLKT